MAKTVKGAYGSPTSSTPLDIYVAPSGTPAMTLLLQVINTSGSSRTIAAYVVSSSNVVRYVLIPTTILADTEGVCDTSKHVIQATDKIRITTTDGTGTDILCEVTAVEGV